MVCLFVVLSTSARFGSRTSHRSNPAVLHDTNLAVFSDVIDFRALGARIRSTPFTSRPCVSVPDGPSKGKRMLRGRDVLPCRFPPRHTPFLDEGAAVLLFFVFFWLWLSFL